MHETWDNKHESTGRSVDRVEGKSVGALDALALDVACIWKYTPADASDVSFSTRISHRTAKRD